MCSEKNRWMFSHFHGQTSSSLITSLSFVLFKKFGVFMIFVVYYVILFPLVNRREAQLVLINENGFVI